MEPPPSAHRGLGVLMNLVGSTGKPPPSVRTRMGTGKLD